MTEPPLDFLRTFAVEFDKHFDAYLTAADVPAQLLEAVRYSALAPGKRIRPYLVVRCCELVGGRRDDAWPAATAIECVHAFSLIHDDLPAMDDDDLRRGRPTTHKQFTEALAILAGDALLTLAFEVLLSSIPDGALAAGMALELARGTGWNGMIGGQAADVVGQGSPPSEALVKYIHGRKTASLFETACRLGAMSGVGRADAVAALGRFGRHLGQAFQIADDLLDVTATPVELGKNAGKDIAAGKQTYPRCVGVEASKTRAAEEVQTAVAELSLFGPSPDDLRTLAEYVVSRNY